MDPLVQEAVEIGTEVLKNIVESTFSSATDWIWNKSKERDFLGKNMRKYAEKMIERYNYVRVLGMHESVPLKSLFVRVNILEKITARMRLSPEELEAFYERDQRRLGKEQKSIDGEVAINKMQRFIVLGKPGAGKTTYLKYLTLAMLDKNSAIKNKRFPIFITLKAWADSKLKLMDFIVQELDICGIENGEDFVERLLKKGKCLVLLDGLDEVSQEANQEDVIQQIIQFSDTYSKNQFVLSCRVAAYNHWFQRFTDVEIADFNDQQIENFIQNWFKREPKIAEECWAELSRHSSLKELAHTPLLLTLLCITYDDNHRFPENRADLYEEAIDALLKKWDASRRIKRDAIYKNLSLSRKRLLFTKVAYATFEDNRYFIDQKALETYIRGIIEHFPGFEEEARLDVDSAAILQGIEAQHGILVQRAQGVYSFSHLTFQEYFAARFLVEHKGDFAAVLIPYLDDARWKEVFLLTAGMLDIADDLLCAIERRQHEHIRANAILTTLLMGINEALRKHPANTYGVLERRISVLLLTLALARSRARVLTRALDFAMGFDSALKNTRVLDLARDGNFDFALEHTRDRDLDFSVILETANFLKESYQKKENDIIVITAFLEANILLVNCLKAARFVHKSTRQRILDNLLSVPAK